MRLETVVNSLPQGASRTHNYSYPPSGIFVQGTTAQQNNLVNRQGTPWQNFFAVASSGGGGAATGFTHYRGRPCFRYGETGATGDWAFTGANQTFVFPQTKPVTNFRDDFACWSFTLVAAFTSGGTEAGIQIGPNVQMNMVTANNPGVGIAMRAANSMSFIACQGGALTVDTQIANTTLDGGTFDVGDWHVYKIVILGANVSSEAVCKVYADGTLRTTRSWGAGTLLPGQASGVNLGWNVSVGSRLGDWYLAICGLNVACAATESGLP